jgi:phosphoribosylformylglycinamidine synthase
MVVRALVLRTAGTNCDNETVFALEQAGFEADRVHVNRLIETPSLLNGYEFLVVPGGFSYGDDVSAGKILANQMLYRLAEPLNRFVENGKLVLGICNGFQVLIKSGLLPWGHVTAETAHRDASLCWNDNGQFVDRWVRLRADSDACVFLPKGEVIELPIAHGEGKFMPASDYVLERMRAGDQLALRYVPHNGETGFNPNGSVEDIAGICDPSGRVLGLMPHPERFVDPMHHPQWTRRPIARADGQLFFREAMAYLR